ncbi:uncharacterized protein LOC135218937 [Macrobrachium nipponense]|uniref:uncharacterized protein LOC135218937 n=1 Tax=Macrobrachium nipponense TaxID=159736 RepID=UPI0030C85A9F
MEDCLKDTKRMGRITSQTRIFVIKVCNYLREQYDKEGEDDIVKRTAAATGISVRSIQRIKQQHKRGEMHSPPPRSRKSPVMGALDDFDKDCVRREIMAFYERGEIPTIEKLLDRVKKPPLNFPGAYMSLLKLVKEFGFRYKKVESGRKLLMERNDIVLARNKYPRLIDENRKSDSPRPEIYLDETWVNQNECVDKCWTLPDGIVGPRVKTGKGARFIIVHAGGEYGFVPGGLLFFRSKNGNKGDYHDSMNHTCFLSWIQTQLLVNIPARSLIVLDNASYYSKILTKAPVSRSKKSDIVSWLTNHNIAQDPSYTKTELLDVVKQHKYLQEYEIDKIARDAGHEVLRLPPYHCEFNPIELIWAQVKNEVKKCNSNPNQTLTNVERITKRAIDKVTAEDRKSCCNGKNIFL